MDHLSPQRVDWVIKNLIIFLKTMAGIAALIHQGRYDSKEELLTLRTNAIVKKRIDVLDAVHQRLKKVHPNIYQRLVGPLRARVRDPLYQCYCNNPASLEAICREIIAGTVKPDCLTCNACWDIDISSTWGYYGYTAKVISKETWKSLCRERSDYKYVE